MIKQMNTVKRFLAAGLAAGVCLTTIMANVMTAGAEQTEVQSEFCEVPTEAAAEEAVTEETNKKTDFSDLNVAVCDSEPGNIGSIIANLEKLGANVTVVDQNCDPENFDALVIPGGTSLISVDVTHEDGSVTSEDMHHVLMDMFYKDGKAILGICRGNQVINWYFGGSVKEVENHADGIMHELDSVEGSLTYKLYGAVTVVNSYHRYAIDQLGEGLEVTATGTDGVIEGIEVPGKNVYGTQWHPEVAGKMGRRFFKAFLTRCRWSKEAGVSTQEKVNK